MNRLLPLIALVALLVGIAPASAEEPVITNTVPPTITGTAQFEKTLTADPGTWTPVDATYAYRWFRSGMVMAGETKQKLKIDSTHDIGKTFMVEITASKDGVSSSPVVSVPTAKVARATFSNTARPTISGTPRFRKTLRATSGRWSRGHVTRSFRWLRNDRPISGATSRSYTLAPSDVGKKIRFRVTARRAGFTRVQVVSTARAIQHLRPVRRTVTYSVTTRGHVTASVLTFKKLAAETYADPRGWRGMGVKLKRVAKGGDFTLVLSQASKVPSFSSACSSTYSCRVGRYVIINQTRWQKATPAWNAESGSLRNYRNLVINHETGHWFGKFHSSCGGKGQLAPVMQQQSKGLHGCKINAWPKSGELHSPRFGY